MSDHTTPLSPRHERFVLEYLKDGNATRAYIRAGYSPRGAQPSASRLLRDVRIAAAVAAGRQRLVATLEVSVERLAQEYAKIAFANVSDYISTDAADGPRIDLDKASEAERAGILELKISNHRNPEQRQITLKLGKLQALAALTRHVGLFTKQPEPGLTAEDRARYRAEIKEHEENWQHGMDMMRQLERERDEAQIALAAAEAKLAAAGLAAPPAQSPEEPPEEPAPPIVLKGLGPPDPPRQRRSPPPPSPSPSHPAAMPGMPTAGPPYVAGPGRGVIFWNAAGQPPPGPTWQDIMRPADGRFPGQ